MGGKLAAAFGLVYLAAGIWAARVQPDAVKAGLSTHPLYHFASFAGYGWLALVVVAMLVAAFAGFARVGANWLGWVAATLALLIELSLVIFAMGCATFRCWRRALTCGTATVVTNWSVVGLFLLLFVGGLGVVGWLISVVARAQKPMEGAVL